MNKCIVKNCPALSYGKGLKFKKCYRTNWKEYCKDYSDCIIKQIAGFCKENKFFSYGAVMLGNGLSADILNLLEIEEAKDD